ncbi:MAG TPA: glycerophosphodiester phosphodiesterase family protein, partial [Gemmatimonadaceae bacterium]|nr:glycerophosphodiester phosphodiesterase family protein [Gemmatimonadaceae bacterium]
MILFDGRARPVIAHRGDRAHAPENTLAAFHAAARAGADGFECDVRLTADGAVVVLHDPRVDRTTDGTGDVTALSVEWIRTLNAGAHWHAHADPDVANSPAGEDAARPFAADGLRIPLLEEVLTTFPGMPVIIECKTLDVVAPMAAVVRRVRAESRVL